MSCLSKNNVVVSDGFTTDCFECHSFYERMRVVPPLKYCGYSVLVR